VSTRSRSGSLSHRRATLHSAPLPRLMAALRHRSQATVSAPTRRAVSHPAAARQSTSTSPRVATTPSLPRRRRPPLRSASLTRSSARCASAPSAPRLRRQPSWRCQESQRPAHPSPAEARSRSHCTSAWAALRCACAASCACRCSRRRRAGRKCGHTTRRSRRGNQCSTVCPSRRAARIPAFLDSPIACFTSSLCGCVPLMLTRRQRAHFPFESSSLNVPEFVPVVPGNDFPNKFELRIAVTPRRQEKQLQAIVAVCTDATATGYLRKSCTAFFGTLGWEWHRQ
jgi:hypothetical protein